ncbi:hypothetical protein HPB48_001579 [Haemaphysalis longicornis]|uniref:RRM domain-containing protein n=1 Tax=Haemaphysalis longicornis TaxID=44386 RepID=A0A9J6FE88_HAELO|nr:hypothetical protein HPB48_001579 [Haemaphysalis longicornis]
MAPDIGDPKPTGPPLEEVKQDNGGNWGKTNLIINYLPQCVTDQEFRRIFTSIGPITTHKTVRHKATGRSCGFGYIDYRDAGDAACAIESLNGLQLLDKRIKVPYARPGGETIKRAKLSIRGIPKDYPLEQAENVFANLQQLIQFPVNDKSGAGNGVAFVLYDLRENAEAAMTKLTGTTLRGATESLVIKHAHACGVPPQVISIPNGAMNGGPKRRSQGSDRHIPLNGYHPYMAGMTPATAVTSGETLLDHYIGTDTDERSLRRFLANYGRVLNVSIIRDTATGLSSEYGFVTMATYEDSVVAIEALNETHHVQ